MAISVAIIGAGPAGFYTAEALLEKTADVRIDIIERLPTPFGLIRAGVAPDHQSTKQVAKKFERTVLPDLVHFYGNVDDRRSSVARRVARVLRRGGAGGGGGSRSAARHPWRAAAGSLRLGFLRRLVQWPSRLPRAQPPPADARGGGHRQRQRGSGRGARPCQVGGGDGHLRSAGLCRARHPRLRHRGRLHRRPARRGVRQVHQRRAAGDRHARRLRAGGRRPRHARAG